MCIIFIWGIFYFGYYLVYRVVENFRCFLFYVLFLRRFFFNKSFVKFLLFERGGDFVELAIFRLYIKYGDLVLRLVIGYLGLFL